MNLSLANELLAEDVNIKLVSIIAKEIERLKQRQFATSDEAKVEYIKKSLYDLEFDLKMAREVLEFANQLMQNKK